MALSVGVGLGALHELMDAEVDEIVGPKGRHDPKRTAKRHGHENGSVTLGGRRVAVSRPRVRSADDERELARSTYRHFADEFVARTAETLQSLMSRRLDDVRLAVLMLDGIELKGRCCVVALGITTEGVKVPLGLWDGSTEIATVGTALLADLVDRGLDTTQGVLCVIPRAKALRKAVCDVLGAQAPVQRCVRHKERNMLDHLPERNRAAVRRRLRTAWLLEDYAAAHERLRALAAELDRSHPGACASLREGLEETLTVTRVGVGGALRRSPRRTSAS